MAGWLTKRHLRRQSKGLINTPSSVLRRLFGHQHYRLCLDILIAKQVVRPNRHYSAGRFSKSYRVCPEYLDDLIDVDIDLPPSTPADLSINRFLGDLSFDPSARPYFEKRLRRLRKPFRRAVWSNAFNAVESRDFWISRDSKTGRVFSNVSSMPKWLRPYLQLRGEPTVEFDIKNSQPFFAATLYPTDNEEKHRYLNLVRSGLFYESINHGLQKPFPPEKRDKLKKKIFREIFFGKVDDSHEAWAVFKDQFPELAALITDIKKDAHNRLALLLQKVEATCLIETLLVECLVADLPIVTVHDSVICRVSDGPKVRALMETALLKITNERPTILEKTA